MKTRNDTSRDQCRFCDDTGWVELKGTVQQHGVTYSRGMAPCRWCETGERRYRRMVELRQPVDTSYTLTDIHLREADEMVSRHEAKAYIEQIQRNLAGIGAIAQQGEVQKVKPIADTSLLADLEAAFDTPEAKAEIAEKKRRAQQALEQGEGTVELPADPPPTQPLYDPDIPF